MDVRLSDVPKKLWSYFDRRVNIYMKSRRPFETRYEDLGHIADKHTIVNDLGTIES